MTFLISKKIIYTSQTRYISIEFSFRELIYSIKTLTFLLYSILANSFLAMILTYPVIWIALRIIWNFQINFWLEKLMCELLRNKKNFSNMISILLLANIEVFFKKLGIFSYILNLQSTTTISYIAKINISGFSV